MEVSEPVCLVGALDAPLELVDAEAVLDEGDLELGDGGAAVSVGRFDTVAAHAVDVARTWRAFRTRVLDV